jgi:pSer/pThr/pTyr-binding forkhead associated (FHA) protein
VYAYWAETDLPIFEKSEELRDISIQADKFINVGGGGSGSKDMGNAVNINIESLIQQDKIRNANDLMMEYRKLPAQFKILQLTFDPDRSEQLANSLTIARTADKGKAIIQSDRGSLTDAAGLQIQSKAKPVNIVLVARPNVTLGKHRRNDIVTRICPRSAARDDQSNKMSRNHCRLELTEKGVFVKDDGSINGTLLDGKTVDAKGRQIKAHTKELELAGVLTMTVRCLSERRRAGGAAYENILNEPLGPTWQAAAKAGLSSITLARLNNLGADDKHGCESYCLVYRIATIGSAPQSSISCTDKGLEPVHAAILHLGRRFYLENVSDLTDVVVNDTTLSKNELTPLSFGDRIRIARLDMKFLQKAQLFIDSLADA